MVRHHLRRQIDVQMAAVTSYDQDQHHGWRRSLPALRAAARIVSTRPRPGLIWHFHFSKRGSYLREGCLLWLAALRRHRHRVVTLHGSDLTSMSRWERGLASMAVRPASVVHVLSSAHQNAVRHPHLVIIHNDVDIPAAVPAAQDRLPQVLFAGEISYRKGVDVLLEAWREAQLEEWHLVLCGPAGDFDLVAAMDLPGVSWRGEVTHDEVLRRMLEVAVVVLPSREEAFPMSLCEAMAAGCAVLATDVGGAKDLLGPDNRFLVSSGDSAALARQLVELASDPFLLSEVATANRRRARQRVATETVNNDWRRLYATLVEGDSAAPARRPM